MTNSITMMMAANTITISHTKWRSLCTFAIDFSLSYPGHTQTPLVRVALSTLLRRAGIRSV